MNRIIRPSKEEPFYAYPNDMGFWADKKRDLPNLLLMPQGGVFWMLEFTKKLPV